MLKKLLHAHKKIDKLGLVIQDFGNVSVRHNSNYFFIKPSGIRASDLNLNKLVKVNINDDDHIGRLKPSSDTPTHSVIYKFFKKVNCIIHTHSTYATIWSQSKKSIPCLGTTHADFWRGSIPLIKILKKREVETNYESNTGKAIVRYFKDKKLSYLEYPGILLSNHGPFVWGENIDQALKNAEALEFISKIAFYSQMLNKNINLPDYLIAKHFYRKNGSKKSYGQQSNTKT